MLPQTRTYVNYASNTASSSSSPSSLSTSAVSSNGAELSLSAAQILFSTQQSNNCREERVKVQRLINHTKLQNNSWNNFRTLYNNNKNDSNCLSALSLSSSSSPLISLSVHEKQSKQRKIRNMNNDNDDSKSMMSTTQTSSAIEVERRIVTKRSLSPYLCNQVKSVFNVKQNDKDNRSTRTVKYEHPRETNAWLNNKANNNIFNDQTNSNNNKCLSSMSKRAPLLLNCKTRISKIQRTLDQKEAFCRIENVHNYAKLRCRRLNANCTKFNSNNNNDGLHLNSPTGSDYSNYDDNNDDNDDSSSSLRYVDKRGKHNEDCDADDADDVDIDIDIDVDYEHYFDNKRQQEQQNLKQQQRISVSNCNNNNNNNNTNNDIVRIYKNEIEVYNNDNNNNDSFNNNKDQNKMKNEEEVDHELQIDVDGDVDNDALGNSTNNVQQYFGNITTSMEKPQHHARRPMNAFLIFCKRHRALVKERYKSLENRAITRVLGDWWATLDDAAKECFIKLAQENKDAFFSAHPNFKWYKLPAPSLRSPNTRLISDGCTNQEFGESFNNLPIAQSRRYLLKDRNSERDNNFFKLADETEMGDLNVLMEYNSSSNRNSNVRQCALQQVLGETTQFLNTHMPDVNRMSLPVELMERKGNTKRRAIRHNDDENSLSSNSNTEDDSGCDLIPQTKKARTCKGKIYQELINSGQITTHMKRSSIKLSPSFPLLENEQYNESQALMVTATGRKFNKQQKFDKIGGGYDDRDDANTNGAIPDEKSIHQTCELHFFNLEERIKELPALNLDDYLQRKRSTKKKRKFTYSHHKKRNYNKNNNNNNNSKNNNNLVLCETTETVTNELSNLEDKCNRMNKPDSEQQNQQLQQQQSKTIIVGSQKRKARKESITRRDISAIENEIASVLTINGNCYLEETPIASINATYPHPTQSHQYQQKQQKQKNERKCQINKSDVSCNTTTSIITVTTTIPPIETMTTTTSHEFYNQKLIENDYISSTSDLLILAEVAAKRTELQY